MTISRLITASPALIASLAALLVAAAATAHRVRRRLAAQPSTTGPRQIVETALWDWWTTTDPLEPFAPDAIAEQVDLYLHSSGFTIAPDIRKNRMTTRRAIAGASLIAILCAISAAFALARGEWWWCLIGALATGLLTQEIIRDLADRRHERTTPSPTEGTRR